MANIFIVDDDPDVVRLVTKTLAARGHTLTTARDGAEALRRIGDSQLDLIVVDRHLPKIDGNELCRRLRLDPAAKGVPILLMTAGEITFEEATAPGSPDGFVVRPFLRDTFLSNVDRLLRKA